MNKNKKLYNKMMRKCRKDLIKASKDYQPYDEGYLFNFMEIIFKNWIDYYELGENVHAEEIKDTEVFNLPNRPTRLEIAKELYSLFKGFCYDIEIKNYDKNIKKFCDYFATYIGDMWD